MRYGKQTRPMRELMDAQDDLCSIQLEPGRWRFGAVHIQGKGYRTGGSVEVPKLEDIDGWRVIMMVDALAYDIVLGKLYDTSDEAYDEAHRLATSLGGT